MIVRNSEDVPLRDLPEYDGVRKAILVGPADGSDEIAMRLFSVVPGGSTPYHDHEFPHIVRVEAGEGVVVDAEGAEHPLSVGQLVYVHGDEQHCFRNTGSGPFDFLCIVPGRGET